MYNYYCTLIHIYVCSFYFTSLMMTPSEPKHFGDNIIKIITYYVYVVRF